jgi:hypothetical protein
LPVWTVAATIWLTSMTADDGASWLGAEGLTTALLRSMPRQPFITTPIRMIAGAGSEVLEHATESWLVTPASKKFTRLKWLGNGAYSDSQSRPNSSDIVGSFTCLYRMQSGQQRAWRQIRSIKTTFPGRRNFRGRNEQRVARIVQEYHNGTSEKQILKLVNSTPGWAHVRHVSTFRKAYLRFCERHRIPPSSRKYSGRSPRVPRFI